MRKIQSPSDAAQHRGARPASVAAPSDLRWQILDLVRICRHHLALRDRDVAVLRGLLSLVPSTSSEWIVHASNRTLIDRCDGIDERTLRRRLSHLETRGLIRRRMSPNGKRFQIRDETGAVQLSYGLDLEPLREMMPHLEALAEVCARESTRVAVARAWIRDVLFRAAGALPADLAEECRRSLRRKLPAIALEALQARLVEARSAEPDTEAEAPATGPITRTADLTATDGQNDRHIQRSYKEESLNLMSSETARSLPEAPAATDISLEECLERAPVTRSFAPTRPRNWGEVIELAALLGPAIGLGAAALRDAATHLTRHGAALAVIGLVEAHGRIRKPEAYLRTLIAVAQRGRLDLCRMFRSLVRPATMACRS